MHRLNWSDPRILWKWRIPAPQTLSATATAAERSSEPQWTTRQPSASNAVAHSRCPGSNTANFFSGQASSASAITRPAGPSQLKARLRKPAGRVRTTAPSPAEARTQSAPRPPSIRPGGQDSTEAERWARTPDRGRVRRRGAWSTTRPGGTAGGCRGAAHRSTKAR